jgi:hypothetical protein
LLEQRQGIEQAPGEQRDIAWRSAKRSSASVSRSSVSVPMPACWRITASASSRASGAGPAWVRTTTAEIFAGRLSRPCSEPCPALIEIAVSPGKEIASVNDAAA